MKKNRIRELYQQYVGGMAEWQIKLAIARMMHFRVPQAAWKDTMQELAVVVCEFAFDPDKAHAASEETILCRLLDNRIRMLARGNARRTALRDRVERMTQELVETRTPDDIAAEAEVRELLGQLTPAQQAICRALMDGQSEYQIAATTGWHYTTICRHLGHIRQIFADRGFDTWSA